MLLPDDLLPVKLDDPYIDLLLNSYSAIDDVYRQSLAAMGMARQVLPEVSNSAQVTLSTQPSSSTANYSPD